MNGQRLATDFATPIKIVLQHPTIAGPDPQAAAAANAKEFFRAYAEVLAKLELLFAHYRLPRTGNDAADYRSLVLRMAPDRFRGFKVIDVNAPKPNYEHRRGNWVTLINLLADVEAVKREHLPRPCSDGQALRALIARRWGDSSTSRLRRRIGARSKTGSAMLVTQPRTRRCRSGAWPSNAIGCQG